MEPRALSREPTDAPITLAVSELGPMSLSAAYSDGFFRVVDVADDDDAKQSQVPINVMASAFSIYRARCVAVAVAMAVSYDARQTCYARHALHTSLTHTSHHCRASRALSPFPFPPWNAADANISTNPQRSFLHVIERRTHRNHMLPTHGGIRFCAPGRKTEPTIIGTRVGFVAAPCARRRRRRSLARAHLPLRRSPRRTPHVRT